MKNFLSKTRRRQILDATIEHFSRAGVKFGINPKTGYCTYGSKGSANRCAVGIHDQKGLLSKVEGSVSVIGEIKRTRQLLAAVFGVKDLSEDDLEFLNEMQRRHDVVAGSHRSSAALKFGCPGLVEQYRRMKEKL